MKNEATIIGSVKRDRPAAGISRRDFLKYSGATGGALFSSGKPRPLGGVRVNWLCLETTPNGVLARPGLRLVKPTPRRARLRGKTLLLLFSFGNRILKAPLTQNQVWARE